MRYGIISDIHSNLEAFEAVMTECRQLKIETLLCCGDIVGYGADPKACIHLVKKGNIVSVAGNHDWAVSGRLDFSYFTPNGQAAVLWTRSQLGMEDMIYLNNLPSWLKNKDCTLVHGTLQSPGQFTYLTNIEKASQTFALMENKVCFVGHTHVPQVYIEREGRIYSSDILDIDIQPDCRYIINVGSVGQPRDRNPLASFCVYDTQLEMIENHRVPYDIERAQQKILEAGLPQALGLRLREGR
ncbi:MAG: metallophosphoesterase family protein [Candidatus Omnitrophica bacterium]|nr:metallophosphoesterase family protein [Candidatus Omnitrophota bacterium]